MSEYEKWSTTFGNLKRKSSELQHGMTMVRRQFSSLRMINSSLAMVYKIKKQKLFFSKLNKFFWFDYYFQSHQTHKNIFLENILH
jgi:hypothetical protein